MSENKRIAVFARDMREFTHSQFKPASLFKYVENEDHARGEEFQGAEVYDGPFELMGESLFSNIKVLTRRWILKVSTPLKIVQRGVNRPMF